MHRIAVVTFVYEGDREIVLDTLDSILGSLSPAMLDLYLADDASASRVGETVVEWWQDHVGDAQCIFFEESTGYRGCIERTLAVLRAVAVSGRRYDYVVRIDPDALVVKEALGEHLAGVCTDRLGLYGVVRRMRLRDACALLLDLMPAGLRRIRVDGRIEHGYGLRRGRPVWWTRIGLMAFLRGFRFRFAEGCFYVLGGDVPGALYDSGSLDRYRPDRYGLITSEEDVIVTLMCLAAGMRLHRLDAADAAWSRMNWIGASALTEPIDAVPYVVHPLKASLDGIELRSQIRDRMPRFR